MNRTVKFRAWDEDGHMFFPTKIEFDKTHPGDTWVWENDVFGQLGSAIVSLMQFTGLLDKNGNEIYEGDVVKITYLPDESFEISQVEWWDIVTGFGDKNAKSIGYYHRKFDQFSIEVIGNIYENKDLLK